MQRIELLDMVAWSEDMDRKIGGLNRLIRSQDVSPIQSQKKLTLSLDCRCQHMEVFGIDERGMLGPLFFPRARTRAPSLLRQGSE